METKVGIPVAGGPGELPRIGMMGGTALSSGLGEEVAEAGLSGYHLVAEVAAASDGLVIAVPEATWRKRPGSTST